MIVLCGAIVTKAIRATATTSDGKSELAAQEEEDKYVLCTMHSNATTGDDDDEEFRGGRRIGECNDDLGTTF